MPRRGFAPAPGVVVELNTGWLIVHLQDIFVALHSVTTPQLDMLAFKLDRESHFLTGIASAHIGGSASNLAFRWGGAQTLNVGCGFWLDFVALTPGMKLLIG